jgi:hypothetical protein
LSDFALRAVRGTMRNRQAHHPYFEATGFRQDLQDEQDYRRNPSVNPVHPVHTSMKAFERSK